MITRLIKPGQVREHIKAVCERQGRLPVRVTQDYIEGLDVAVRSLIRRSLIANNGKRTIKADVFYGIPATGRPQ